MQPWLLIAAALQAAPGAQFSAQMRGLEPIEIGHLATAHALDFRLKQDSHVPGPVPLTRGMLIQHEMAPNAAVGIGLSNLYDRRKPGFDGSSAGQPRHSRKPAVTFVLKF